MKTLNVDLPDKSYPIYIGRGLLASLTGYLSEFQLDEEIYIITDDQVKSLYGEKIIGLFESAGITPVLYSVPVGESSKSLSVLNDLYTQLLQHRASRKSTIVAFGGGVVGDLAGFVAATYLRGVKFVQVPTTILSQVDSSVGGKVGINHAMGKNLIGAFYQPQFVLIDTDVLNTLPKREILAGLAEVIKYGYIQDAKFINFMQDNLTSLIELNDDEKLEHMLATCCQIKANVVSKDEKEAGLRAILNFGHTAGHALEAVTGYKTFLHGEAVSHGMRAALHLSVLEELLDNDQAAQALKTIDLLQPPVIPDTITTDALLSAMQNDKKRTSAGQLWVLLQAIGEFKLTRDVSDDNVQKAVQFMLDAGRIHV